MKSFKEFTGGTENNETAASAEELTKKIAAAYHGKSNADMMRSILIEAEKSKRAGTLSNEEIEAFYQTFSPMLDSIQRKRLRGVVEKLKNI
ncbi:MAG: hypothetical protein E7355_01170 [Clostridiales bacterium]|nr:hypothetical protein [Clostridiales bacterium]